MQTVLIAPDKFKGCLTAVAVSQAIADGFLGSGFSPVIVPLADGGEGTVALLTAAFGGELISVAVHDSLMRLVLSEYGYSESDRTAFIEMAAAAGLWRLRPDEYDPEQTSTFGVGEIILDALNRGAQHIVIGCGGSSTNDAGLGMAAALGFLFYDKTNRLVDPMGSTLKEIFSIDNSQVNPKVNSATITVIADVKNCLAGNSGAAYVFGPQKGATPDAVIRLDAGLENIRNLFLGYCKQDMNTVPGSGAGGGFPAGALCLLEARIISGIEFIMEQISFEKKVQDADLVITGEGQLDNQSANGKVVSGVAEICQKYNKPLWIVCGRNSTGAESFGPHKIISLSSFAGPDADTFLNAPSLIKGAIQAALK
jgi:glycerate kinase